MKKIMTRCLTLCLVLAAALGSAVKANAGERIAPDQVPAALMEFIHANWGPDMYIIRADRDAEPGGFEYDVTLHNGVMIEFGVSEIWVEVDGEDAGVNIPNSVLGEDVISYLAVNYPGKTVRKIERKKQGYEVELNDGHKAFIGSSTASL